MKNIKTYISSKKKFLDSRLRSHIFFNAIGSGGLRIGLRIVANFRGIKKSRFLPFNIVPAYFLWGREEVSKVSLREKKCHS
jgi:hypothetical protein